MKGQRTITTKESDIEPQWWLVNAEGVALGRLASQVAQLLRGKHRPDFSPHLALGDHVVVINAGRVAVSGDKLASQRYYRHSGYPGGLRERTLAEMLERCPDKVIRLAVFGMLPRNRLRRTLMGKLRVYAGAEHPHHAQSPRPWTGWSRGKETP